VGGSQGEIKAVKAGRCEAHDECRSTEENWGGATEEMGFGEGEDDWLTRCL